MNEDTGGILLRFALYLDLMALFGLAAFGLHGLRGAERRFGAVLPSTLFAVVAAFGLLLSAIALLALAAAMSGVAPGAVDGASIQFLLWETSIGTAWLARMVALAIALLLVPLGRSRPAVALAGIAVAGAVALGSLAWTGHGAAGEGAAGWLHLGADLVHLLAAGVWVGALLALMALVLRSKARVDIALVRLTHRALHGFSTTGTIVVALLIVTGTVSAWVLVGPEQVLTPRETLYGRLLLAKLALFMAMLALAAANRFRLTPGLDRALGAGNYAGAMRALRRSLLVETGCALLILTLVARLGTLEPPAAL